MYEPFQAKIANTDLIRWYDAVQWSRLALQAQIKKYNANGLNTAYDETQLEKLVELEQFLKMSWDQWKESVFPSETTQEVK